MYSPRFESALTLAGLRHKDQIRKGTGAPYLTHLVHVAAILARAGYDEDTQIVGLLHDILEDTTSGPVEVERVALDIQNIYGADVADAVRTLTEPKRNADGQRIAWRKRKDAYLAQIKRGSLMAARVSAADKLHNLSTLAEEIAQQGDEVWKRFNAGPEQTFWFYHSVYQVVRVKADGPIVEALSRQLQAMGISL